MTSQVLFEIVRFLHILCGILWVGAMVMLAFFVAPSVGAVGPAGGAVMNQLSRVRKLPAYLGATGGLTVLAGIGLIWLNMSATEGAWGRTGAGQMFLWGGVVGIVGFLYGALFSSRMARRLAARTAALSADGRTPTPEEQAEIRRGFARLGTHGRLVAILLLIAATMMALARYV